MPAKIDKHDGSAARALLDSLSSYSRIQELIEAGEAEGQYLECKAPQSPQLTREQRVKLGISASGFGNGGGGVIIWGVSTDKHRATGLDVLTQINPIGAAKRFAQQVDTALPGLTTPQLALQPSRVLRRRKVDTKGIVVTYLLPTLGDPVRSTRGGKFWLRAGDSFVEMPYETLRRMFVGAQAPAIVANLAAGRVPAPGELWEIPVQIYNESTAAAHECQIVVEVLNAGKYKTIIGSGELKDVSDANPGKKLFIAHIQYTIFQEVTHNIGWLTVSTAANQHGGVLRVRISAFADRMRPREWVFKVALARKGTSIKDVRSGFVH